MKIVLFFLNHKELYFAYNLGLVIPHVPDNIKSHLSLLLSKKKKG